MRERFIIGPSSRVATLVVAASNASQLSKYQADYVCDGVNDEVEIEAAYARLPALIGGKIQLTEGVFEIGTTLNLADDKPVNLHGVGFLSYWPAGTYYPAGSILKLSDGANCRLLNIAGGWSCGSLKGLWFDGNKSNQGEVGSGSGILINNKGDIFIEHCMFDSFKHDLAVELSNHGSWISFCDFEELTGSGIPLAGLRNWISQNHFARIEGSFAVSVGNAAHYKQWIINNNFRSLDKKAIDLATSGEATKQIIVQGNIFDDWAIGGVETAIRLRANCSKILILDNIFKGGESSKYGIFSAGADDGLSQIVIRGNIFSGITDVDISLSGDMTDCIIADNNGTDFDIIGDLTRCAIHDNICSDGILISDGTPTNCSIHDNV